MCTKLVIAKKVVIIMYHETVPQQQYSKDIDKGEIKSNKVCYTKTAIAMIKIHISKHQKVHKMCTNIAIANYAINISQQEIVQKNLQPNGYGKSLACSGVSDIFIFNLSVINLHSREINLESRE